MISLKCKGENKAKGDRFDDEELTRQIIGCFYTVYNTLGYGFLESVYEKALQVELIRCGLTAERQRQILVEYRGVMVGEYYTDILVNEKIILELKTSEEQHSIHEAQIKNYLAASKYRIGLLLYFGSKARVRRYEKKNPENPTNPKNPSAN